MSRNRNHMRRFDWLAQEIKAALPGPVILDGEIACFDDTGQAQFFDMFRRKPAARFAVFDLVWTPRADLRCSKLRDRKTQLRRYREAYAEHQTRFRRSGGTVGK